MTIPLVMRQMLVLTSPQLAAVSVGGAMVYPTILIQQFKNDSSLQLDLDTTSWLGSIHGLGGIPSILMPCLMQWKGRKLAFIVTCLIVIVGWLLAYLSTSIITVLVSESFHGLGTNSLLAITQLSVSEMVPPKYRNISLQSYGTIQSLGMVCAGVMARYLHWKSIGLVMCVPIAIALLIGCTWPESPSWLASKGEFDKCEAAFAWLRGMDDDSRKELNEIIAAQKKISIEKRKSGEIPVTHFWRTVTSRDFYLPAMHIFVLMNLMYWSGNMVIIIYCVEILKTTTSSELASFASIIINSILLVGFGVSCIFLRLYKNKSVLMVSTILATIFLFGTSMVTYLQSINVLAKDSLLCLYCLTAFMIASSLGPIPVVFTIAAELMPVKHRGVGGAIYVVYTCLLHSSSLKAAPYLFLYLNLSGTLLIYAVNSTICSLLIWKFVPETKGKTLQDIEDYYAFGSFPKREHSDADNKLINHS